MDANHKHAALRMILLAVDELKGDHKPIIKSRVITLAKQYGRSLGLTRKDIETVLSLTVTELFEIKNFPENGETFKAIDHPFG